MYSKNSKMCKEEVNFADILEPRRTESGIFSFMSRYWNPLRTLVLDKQYSPQDLKDAVASSVYLDSVIEAESARSGVSKRKLHQEVLSYLEEMGLDKKLYVIRWMGVVFLKIVFMMKIKLYVNEPAVLKLKSTMGSSPVLFLPTHRSYADFCLMTYLSFHYDIDFPAVAAGMDFYSMAIVGKRMRETCAFYIRRTLVGAPLYAATLKQYVRTLVGKHSAPIEFFLEGTRSRSNKSLPPKYGMLSMTLLPLFAREVTDIHIVPVNITYERIMEHGLFAYEHLGVPKPKESTGGLIKALSSLNDHYGNIYINLGSPISVRDYIGDIKSTEEVLKPVELQQLTPHQFKKVQDVADHVISQQQKHTVGTITNLVSLVLMQSLIKETPVVLDEVVQEVQWIGDVLRSLGASVSVGDVGSDVERILVVHRKMMKLDREHKLRLIAEALMDVSGDVKAKMKGHILAAETMTVAVPVIQLQLYVNSVLHYLVPPAVACLLTQGGALTRDNLSARYYRLRKLLKHEFFYVEKCDDKIFQDALGFCITHNVIRKENDLYCVGEEFKLLFLLKWTLWPALASLLMCIEVMTEQVSCEHRQALKRIQERVESSRCHPYCLSLEATANCLQGLTGVGALIKQSAEQSHTYSVVPEAMDECLHLVAAALPTFTVDFGRTNPVILDQKAVARL